MSLNLWQFAPYYHVGTRYCATIDYNKKLFTTDYKFKYSDMFDIKFFDLTELFLFLFKKYVKF